MEKYDIGYCKPPKKTQFKPGTSGNKKGRPRGSKNTLKLLEEELSKKIVVKEGGKIIRLSKRESIIKQAVNKAIQGDKKSIETIIKLMFEVDANKERLEKVISTLKLHDQKIISNFMARNSGGKDE